jgi:hypothetical protein
MSKLNQASWCTSIIPTTPEVEARELKDQSQPLSDTLSQNKIRPGMVAQACNPSYSGGRAKRDVVQGQPGQKVLETLNSTNER